jgi:hypothetical protein
MRNVTRLVRKPKEYIPLDRSRLRRENNNNKLNLKEIGCESVHWIHLAQYRVQWWDLVDIVMSFNVS